MAWQAKKPANQHHKILPDGKLQAPGKLRHRFQLLHESTSETAVHALSNLVDFAFRQSQRLAHVSYGTGIAILDEVADHGRAFGCVLLEDMPEHPVACFTAEVEVDIRDVCQRPVFAEKALDGQVVLDGIDAGETQEKADQGANRGTAAAHWQLIVVRVSQDVP